MSKDFTKNRVKRQRSSSIETSNSFVKNVTSRMSGLLPATISKWFGHQSPSNSNGSAPTADATDSSTEDEATESHVATQPPVKRMRYSSPGKGNHYNADGNQGYCVPTTVDPMEPRSLYAVQSTPVLPAYRRDYVSPPLRSPSEDSASEDLTTVFKSQPSTASTGPSVAAKRKSLFDSPSRVEESERACARTSSNTLRDPREPCFKPSLLGSPFYPGRTTYGGASTAYINHPNIRQRKNTLVNETSAENNAISHSARRIMDLLEHYSSPLNEARRIPQYDRTARHNTYDASQQANKSISYKTQELNVPSIASILQLKKRSRLMDSTTAARQLIASHSSTLGYDPHAANTHSRKESEIESSNLTTKVKTRVTRQKRGEASTMETDMLTPIKLPSAVLNIDRDQLPKFSFMTPSVSNAPATSTPRLFSRVETKSRVTETKTTTIVTETPISKPETISNTNPYTFASPVTISSGVSRENYTAPKFLFGSPERRVDRASFNETVSNPSCVVGKPKETESETMVTMKTSDWQCPSCWVFNKADVDKCVCCECKKPSKASERAKCTVCKRGDGQPHCSCAPKTAKPTSTKTVELTKWKCEDCWVNNDVNADKCVCCGGKKPNSASATPVPVVNDVGNRDWKCDDCWIKNKSNLDTCAACGAAKPTAKRAPPTPFGNQVLIPPNKPPDSRFQNIVKSQTDKWECANCLVRNDINKTKCACCETERSGVAKEPGIKTFNFGVNTSFKFGIDPKLQEANAVKPTEKSDAKSKVEESETNNNVLSTTPSFSFGLPAKKSDDKTDAPKKVEEKTDNAPKMNFTFGVPKTIESQPVASNFATASKSPEPAPKVIATVSEKSQEVPKVDLSVAKTQEASEPLPNFFAPPITTTAVHTKSDLLNTTFTLEKKETSGNVISLPNEATRKESTPKPTFTFPTMVQPVKLAPFTPNAPAALKMPFAPSHESVPSTSAVNIFQTSEPAATTVAMFNSTNASASTSVPLFKKSEPTTAAPLALGSAAPIFSFGTNTQTQPAAPTEPEKPKFNFSFGSNNSTETTAMFKPTFGTTDSSANKFSLGMGNAAGSGIITGASVSGTAAGSLGGGNGLPTMQVNTSETNPLSKASGLQSTSALPATSSIFGAAIPKESMWSPNNNNNLYVTNALTNNNNLFVTKSTPPKAFSFGGGLTTFNATGSAPPAFGTNSTAPPAFSSNSQAPPTFGSNSQPAANVFGMPNQNASNQPLFSSPGQGQNAVNVFGSPASSSAAPLGMFGAPSVAPAATFGAPNASLPPFEAPSLAPAPAPAFNFGQTQSTGIFGFGQQSQQQPQQPSGVYSFGAVPGASPQVQFNMGSAPNTAVRRVRKAVRRNPPR